MPRHFCLRFWRGGHWLPLDSDYPILILVLLKSCSSSSVNDRGSYIGIYIDNSNKQLLALPKQGNWRSPDLRYADLGWSVLHCFITWKTKCVLEEIIEVFIIDLSFIMVRILYSLRFIFKSKSSLIWSKSEVLMEPLAFWNMLFIGKAETLHWDALDIIYVYMHNISSYYQ